MPPSIINFHLFNNPIEHLASYQIVSWALFIALAAERRKSAAAKRA